MCCSINIISYKFFLFLGLIANSMQLNGIVQAFYYKILLLIPTWYLIQQSLIVLNWLKLNHQEIPENHEGL